MSEDDKKTADIVRLKTKARPDAGLMLVPPPFGKCQHYANSYEVDVDAGECVCLACGDKVSPIFVLERLMKAESRFMRARESYQSEMKRLKERSKTKCDHCGHMTRISRK